ncbi:MAG: hypothetical protein QXG52_08065 [Candidatus Caldarchaeum sp.]
MENNPDCGACNNIPLWIGRKPHQILEGIAWMYYTLAISRTNLRRVGSAGGCYRVEAIKHAGGYDPKFRVAAEDGCITYRIWKSGWKLKIDTENYYYHIIRRRIRDIVKEYKGWGSGAALETYVNTGRRFDFRLLKFMVSPITGLKYGMIYRRFVKTTDYTRFKQCAFTDAVYLPERIKISTVLFNIPFYAVKRYTWVYGYVRATIRGV